MSLRRTVAFALLDSIRRFEPRAGESDLSFFGDIADVSSAVPRKFGLDITPEIVYDIKTTTFFGGALLFSEVWERCGYLNFVFSSEALSIMAREALSSARFPSFPDVMEAGDNPRFVRAALTSAADQAREDGSIVPSGAAARRALTLCLMADTPERKRLAAKRAFAVLREHRLAKTDGNKNGVIPKQAALAMAAALEEE